MHSFAKHIFLIFTLLTLTIFSGCIERSSTREKDLSSTNYTTIISDVCIISDDTSFLPIIKYINNTLGLNIVYLTKQQSGSFELKEPTELIKNNPFLNGFYADYLFWKNNYKSPDPTKQIYINTWIDKEINKGQEKTKLILSETISEQYNLDGFVERIINSSTKVKASYYFFINENKGKELNSYFNKEFNQQDIAYHYDAESEQLSYLTLESLTNLFNQNQIRLDLERESIYESDIQIDALSHLLDRILSLVSISLKEQVYPSALKPSVVQAHVLDRGQSIYPILGINPHEKGFQAIQKLIAAGWYVPNTLSRSTLGTFELTSTLTGKDADRMLLSSGPNYRGRLNRLKQVNKSRFISEIWKAQSYPLNEPFNQFSNIQLRKDVELGVIYYAQKLGTKHPWFTDRRFDKSGIINLNEAALLLDLVFNPLRRNYLDES